MSFNAKTTTIKSMIHDAIVSSNNMTASCNTFCTDYLNISWFKHILLIILTKCCSSALNEVKDLNTSSTASH